MSEPRTCATTGLNTIALQLALPTYHASESLRFWHIGIFGGGVGGAIWALTILGRRTIWESIARRRGSAARRHRHLLGQVGVFASWPISLLLFSSCGCGLTP
jgi:hypothetical protein